MMLAAVVVMLVGSAAMQAKEPARVEAARKSKMPAVHAMFDAAHVAYPPKQALLRAFKKDAVLELWASSNEKGALTLVHEFKICAASGELGPKKKQGDLQVPEGFYNVDKLNPVSQFHLSLHVDYPNAADRKRGKRDRVDDLGGDIMVHGNCVTIGCIPIEDDPIEMLYLVVNDTMASTKASTIPIAIFPAKDIAALIEKTDDAELRAFWKPLADANRIFDEKHTMPIVSVDADGTYAVTAR